MARRYFGTLDAVGRTLRFIEGRQATIRIIGVAADSTYFAVREPATSFLYLPQTVDVTHPSAVRARILVRTTPDAAERLPGTVSTLVASMDSGVKVDGVRALGAYVDDSLSRDRVMAIVASGLALLALLISGAGLFGVLAAGVSDRARDIAIRVAIGATPGRILTSVAAEGLALTGTGLALGACGAGLGSPALQSIVFNVPAGDPATVAGVVGVLLLLAATACLVPALRAIRIDPAVILRRD
jgi:putative ABC transport system permease protein